MKTNRTLMIAASLVLVVETAAAQLPDAGAAGFSMGGNYLAAARGYSAVQYNPANLGLPGNAGFTLNLLTGAGAPQLGPVKFNDISTYAGKLIPDAVKNAWLTSIGTGTEKGNPEGGLSLVAASVGHLGFQLGVVGAGAMNLNADAAEALLFGNAGRTGTARNFNFAGSSANGGAFGVGAVSIGIPIVQGTNDGMAIGITGKYIRGLAAGRAMDAGSSVTTDNVNVQFPVIYTDSAHLASYDAGSGMGADVGIAWASAANSFGVTVKNIVNTFAWSTAAFKSRVGSFSFDGTTSKSNFREDAYASAPAALRKALEDEKFKPEIAVGFAHRAGDLLLAFDGSQRLGDGIDIGPKMHIGGGAEYTGLGVLALRAGAAVITDGFQMGGGVGIHVGAIEIGGGASLRSRNGSSDYAIIVSVLSLR